LFDGASPDGTAQQLTITRVHQAFGRNFQLPNSTAHNETCAAIGGVLWNWRMYLITGQSKYADVVEHTLLNSVLAGVSMDGTKFFYTNTLRQLNPMPVDLRWNRRREEVMGCWCCPPNVARILARVHEYSHVETEEGDLHVVLYGGSEYRGNAWHVRQETGYPWDGRVRITVERVESGERALLLRIPGWAVGATVSLNAGSAGVSAEAGTMCVVRRVWRAGDVVELDLPMPVRLIEAHPLVEEARNHVTVLRGPLVYCLESVDLPPGVGVMDITLDVTRPLTARTCDSLPGGIVAIDATGRAHPSRDWSGSLYRTFDPAEGREIALTLIPYFAWDNRGESEMTVWIPR
jgi:DUF1680 family protein